MPDPRNKPILRTRAADPTAVGANLSITPNTGAGWLIRSLTFRFVTGANVGTRSVILQASQGSDVWFRSSPGGTQANSLTRLYGAYSGSAGASSQGSAIMFGLPTDGLWLPQGNILATSVENIDPADQIDQVVLQCIEFPTGPEEMWWPVPPSLLESSE